eukprot:TRINITY_DN777_c0_g2_i2.p1 TRINITY_DN777_c0_g2~~TRINITY_DN777_c0_g2_i2.p1  ORF type:complete len:189 (-),score=47.33 TRINITY_DN777_c0_g2_i2:180-677(-)
MGNKQTTLTKTQRNELEKLSHFGKGELKLLYLQFSVDAVDGKITRNHFEQVIGSVGITDRFLKELLFGSFDTNKDGSIDFKEFVIAISIMTKGTVDERLEFAFHMYDLDGNGFLEKDEVIKIMRAINRLDESQNGLVSLSGKRYSSVESLVDEIFGKNIIGFHHL